MNQFPTIRKLDSAILYALELFSSLSIILLSLGLVLSMSNVLTDGAILTSNIIMSRIWAVAQTVAIDTGMSGTIVRVFVLARRRHFVQMSLYVVLSVVLLFTAAIVSNIESVQQTLNITLAAAYTHSPVSIESLVWLRSISIVLLIVAHAVKYADGVGSIPTDRIQDQDQAEESEGEQEVNEQVVVTEDVCEQPKVEQPDVKSALPPPKQRCSANMDMLQRVQAYMLEHPNATARKAGSDLNMSASTANKYMRQIKERSIE